jgi:hypothetical protein
MLNFRFLETQNMEVAENRVLSLEQALMLLDRLNSRATEEGKVKSCVFCLEQEDETSVLEMELNLPVENFNLFLEIETGLRAINDSPETAEFIEYIRKEFPKYSLPKVVPEVKRTVLKRKKREPDTKETESEKPPKKAVTMKVNRKIIITILGIVFIICLSFAGLYFLKNSPGEGRTEELKSYESLLAEGEYNQAASLYKNKVDDIEQILYEKVLDKKDEKSRDQLQNFIDKNKTKFGRFDESILDSDYTTAVEEYETNNDKFKNDTNRLTLAGYAYLKINDIDQAKKVAKIQTLIELEKKIFDYEQLKQAIQEKEEELQKLAAGGSKNRKKAEEVATEKFALQEELLNL